MKRRVEDERREWTTSIVASDRPPPTTEDPIIKIGRQKFGWYAEDEERVAKTRQSRGRSA
jgi:DNA invertase Pin-like site-specific DNA recombinase